MSYNLHYQFLSCLLEIDFKVVFISLGLCVHIMCVEHWTKLTFSLVCIVGCLPSACVRVVWLKFNLFKRGMYWDTEENASKLMISASLDMCF